MERERLANARNEKDTAPQPSLADRFRGAVWGQFAGDAFCLGAHWIYDLAELGRRFPGGVSGFEAPAEGHYHAGKRTGDLTHYGDAALVLLRSVAGMGRFDAADFGSRFVALFGSDDYRGYRDHATRGVLDNYRAFVKAHPGLEYHFQGGADDDQPATATRLVPVVIAHYRDDRLLGVVESATRAGQDNDRAVAYMKAHALVLRELFGGAGLRQALETAAQGVGGDGAGAEVAAAIASASEAVPMTVVDATLKFGQTCPLAGSFPAAVQCALKYETDVARAIAETANAGGDSAGRAALIGAWLGARLGVGAIPADWRDRLSARAEIDALTERLAGS